MTTSDNPDVPKLEELKIEAINGEGRQDTTGGSNRISLGSIPETETDSRSSAGSAPGGKKRGRKPGSKNRPKDGSAGQSEILPKPLVLFIIKTPYDIAAKRYGEHWKLSDEEAERMLPAHMELAAQYLPDWLRENAALYSVIAFHSISITSKMMVELKIRQLQADKDAGNEPEKQREPKPETVPDAGSSDNPRDDGYGKVVYAETETLPPT